MLSRKVFIFYPNKDSFITYDYAYQVMSNIYKYISEIDKSKEDFLHNKGYQLKSGHVYKLFNHTLRFKGAKFNKNNIFIPKTGIVFLTISGTRKNIDIITQGIENVKKLVISNSMFTYKKTVSSKKVIFANKMEYKTLSPVVTRTKNDKGISEFVSIQNTEKYFKNIAVNAMRKYKLVFNKEFDNNKTPIYFDIDINNIKEKSIKIKNNGYVRGYLYTIRAECSDKNMQKILYYAGIGEKNSLGFGTLEYVKGEW